ncbi:MAG: DegT/DnrJ/EryC1/StrS family aminotransferase [Bacteroidales bacterium]|nr:DegT/DnrJ/EryC1/StrS family aminotransferase [Bacteroidales bacterium]
MKTNNLTRRKFIGNATAGTVGAMVLTHLPVFGHSKEVLVSELAVKGGEPVRTEGWLRWPVWNSDAEKPMLSVLRSGNWYRGNGTKGSEFEKKYADLIGIKRVVATASGTTALETALHVMEVDAGDEVIVSPYTFIATYNVVFNQKALPVFADTDQETFNINPHKIEEKITERTKAILPVHILGLPADMNRINAIAKKNDLVVIEDACQAWLAEYEGKKCGTLGDLGCFSFQNSKNIPSGEGGAVVGNDDAIMDHCYSYHNCGRAHGKTMSEFSGYPFRGGNKRLTEFQAVILMSQMERAKSDADKRLENALYLDSKLKEMPGIIPYKLTEGATRSAYHLYPFRYKKEFFDDLPREKFLAALSAEGIPCDGGYGPQYHDGLMEEALSSKGYKRLFSEQRLNRYREELHNLPDNDQLTREAVWFFQNMLLADRKDMDDIIDAIQKVYENRKQLL